MSSHPAVYKSDGDVHLQTLVGLSGREEITIIPMHPHSPWLKQLSTGIISIATVGLEDINKALPVNPLPSAGARDLEFPCRFPAADLRATITHSGLVSDLTWTKADRNEEITSAGAPGF